MIPHDVGYGFYNLSVTLQVQMLAWMQTLMSRLQHNRNLMRKYKGHFQQRSIRWCHVWILLLILHQSLARWLMQLISYGYLLVPKRKARRLSALAMHKNCAVPLVRKWKKKKNENLFVRTDISPLWKSFFAILWMNLWFQWTFAISVRPARKYSVLLID